MAVLAENDMQGKITRIIKDALKNLAVAECDFAVEHPDDIKNGDYFSNVALVCGKIAKINPKELAEKIKLELEKNLPQKIEKIEIAGAGFINFYLTRDFFRESVEEILNQGENAGKNKILAGQKIMIEYTQPNPFKPFHIGHLMSNAIGESISRLLQFSGAEVSRANYQGDIGLHVAKAIYGLLRNLKLAEKTSNHNEEAQNIGKAYVFGAQAYEDNEGVKKEIDEINKKVYARSDEKINELYDWGFKVTMEAFEDLYKILGTKFDYYFLESAMAIIGEEIVRANVGEIFEKSDGAIVFQAEKHDPKLHTRVFITSQGLPTYETKELGLTYEKFRTDPDMTLSLTITANEQAEYMKVVAKALSLIHPEYEKKMKHITHGMMRLAHRPRPSGYGQGATAEGFASLKMSSRKGNVITGESLLRDVCQTVEERMKDRKFSEEEKKKVASDLGVSAIKYNILKQASGNDIVYNFDQAISLEGDSGPYLCYSYARANSVLEKAKKENILPDPHAVPGEIFEVEKLLYRFPEIVLHSAQEYQPHHIANYLIELARAFNSFYGSNIIADKNDRHSPYKVALTFAFSFVMQTGLHLLGIQAPKKM